MLLLALFMNWFIAVSIRIFRVGNCLLPLWMQVQEHQGCVRSQTKPSTDIVKRRFTEERSWEGFA